MLYVAVSFLIGIMWLHIKSLAIFLFLLSLFILYRKKQHLFVYIVVLIMPIISATYYTSYLHNNNLETQTLLAHPEIKQHGTFISFKSHHNHKVVGTIQLNNQHFSFHHYNYGQQKQQKIDLTHFNCHIKGYFHTSKANDVVVIVKQIDVKSCHKDTTKLPNIFNTHKNFIYNQMEKYGGKEYGRVLALLFGDVHLLSVDQLEDVKRIGIYHLLAVSGSHIVSIIIIIQMTCTALRIPIPVIKCLLCIALPCYAFYVDFVPSALRAIISALLIILLPRKILQHPIDILATTFLIVLLLFPAYIYDIGFQFSILITLFILLGKPLIAKDYPLRTFWHLNIITFLGAFIISAVHFNEIQWVGLIANLFFIPFYTFLLFPLAIVCFLLSHITHALYLIKHIMQLFFWLHDLLVNLLLPLSHWQWYIPKLTHIELVFVFISVLTIFMFYVMKWYLKCAIVCLSLTLIIALLPFDHLARFTLFDVGNGDAMLFETPQHRTVMIDTGGKLMPSNKDYRGSITKYKILPALKQRNIHQLDYLIITHPHLDHMGEFKYLASMVKIKSLIINPSSYQSVQYSNIFTIAKLHNISIIDSTTITHIDLDECSIQLLDAAIITSDDKNEHSIITLINYKQYQLLLMADATIRNEQLLLQRYNLKNIDVLKVGHHGSITSSSGEFIASTKPKISVISASKNNRYQFPASQVVSRLAKSSDKIYNTAQHGAITIVFDAQMKTSVEKS